MGYVKNTWVDQDVERPKTYEVTTNQDGSITLTDSFGLVTELGTPVNATNMNHIENGLALSDLMKYDATVTYGTGEWVTGVVDNEKGIYASLVDNNTGNALSDDTKWEKVQLGGATRNIGEIIQSTIPLTDAGLHLLDGALIDGNGIYSAFVDYIASIYDASASYFTTEASWQDSVTNYGVCGKFVYDSVNNTVRLPKYSNKIYTKSINSTAPVVGNGNALGLTGAGEEGKYYMSNDGVSGGKGLAGTSGVDYIPAAGSARTGTFPNGTLFVGVSQNTAKSGLIAQLSNITTSVDGYYYIVVATSSKTDIEVDIDEVATDLNGKADVDLTNVNNAGTSLGASWAMPSDTYDTLTLGASGTTYIAPANGYFYLSKVAGSDWYYVRMRNAISDIDLFVDGYKTSPLTSIIPAKKGDTVYVYYNATGTTNYFRFIYAQGSESEA